MGPVSIAKKKLTQIAGPQVGSAQPALVFAAACTFPACLYEVSFSLSVLTDGISKCYIIKFYLKMSPIDSAFISCHNSSLYQSKERWENPN